MQELKGNYCVVELDRYEKLIIGNIEQNKIITELNKRLENNDNVFNSLEKYFFKKIMYYEGYHIENLKNYDFNDYHYLQLYNCFTNIGIIDNNNYIENSIKIIVEKYKNEGDEKHGN